MATKTYLIKLTPIDPYYFGTDVTFGEDGKNYFVRGRKLPQQTTLLGWLRYELLVQNNILGDGTSPDEITLVGSKGFNRQLNEEKDYGKIKSISPVFVADSSHYYIPQAKDWANVMENGRPIGITPLITQPSAKVHSSYVHKYRNGGVAQYTGNNNLFKDKVGLSSLWVKNDGIGSCLDEFNESPPESLKSSNGFFTKRMQTGNKKNADDETCEEDGYFRQEYYQLLPGFSFAFLADLDLEPSIIFSNRITQMGGEQSSFRMEVSLYSTESSKGTDVSSHFLEIFPPSIFQSMHNRYNNALLLTSDAYAIRGILDHCDYAIVSTVPFNSFEITPQVAKNYAALSSEKGKQIELLERGSIFFANDLSELMGALNQESWQQIGYNYYLQLLTK